MERFKTDESQLIAVPLPEETETYTPISNQSFIENIRQKLGGTDFKIRGTSFHVNRKMSRVVGVYQLQSNEDQEIGPSIAFRNSYDKSMSAGLAAGAGVFACTNGMFTGEITIMRKHTGQADSEMISYIEKEIEKLQISFGTMKGFKERLKLVTLKREVVYKLVGDLYLQDEIITSEQLSLFRKELYHPTIDYGVKPSNAWNIYNLLTYAIEQKAHPNNYLDQHEAVYKYFQELTA